MLGHILVLLAWQHKSRRLSTKALVASALAGISRLSMALATVMVYSLASSHSCQPSKVAIAINQKRIGQQCFAVPRKLGLWCHQVVSRPTTSWCHHSYATIGPIHPCWLPFGPYMACLSFHPGMIQMKQKGSTGCPRKHRVLKEALGAQGSTGCSRKHWVLHWEKKKALNAFVKYIDPC